MNKHRKVWKLHEDTIFQEQRTKVGKFSFMNILIKNSKDLPEKVFEILIIMEQTLETLYHFR